MDVSLREKKYFDVILEKDGYHIEETSKKPKIKDFAISTLKNLEKVIKQKMEYSPTYSHHEYSKLSKNGQLNLFKEKAQEITEGYVSKLSKVISKKKKTRLTGIINVHQAKVENSINPVKPIPGLSFDAFQVVCKYLSFEELASFKRTHEAGNKGGDRVMVQRARNFGYKGEDSLEATKYLKKLYKEVEALAELALLPIECFFFKSNKKEIACYKTLQYFQNLPSEYLFNLFSKKTIYTASFQKIRKIFKSVGDAKITEKMSDFAIQKGGEALLLAAKNGEINILETLLKKGVSPNISDVDGNTPLHNAVYFGHLKSVEILLKYNADINKIGAGGFTPLGCACNAGIKFRDKPYLAILETLLKMGANPNIPCGNKRLPLHLAAFARNLNIVQMLIKYKSNINERDCRGFTPLCLACVPKSKIRDKHYLDVAEILLKNKADPNLSCENENAPLHYAVKSGFLELVKVLVENQAKINQPGEKGYTPLCLACGAGMKINDKQFQPIVEFLLEQQADPYIRCLSRSIPLHFAAQGSYLNIIRTLLEYISDINIQGAAGNTALSFACGAGMRQNFMPDKVVVKFLLKKGANPNIFDDSWRYPLHFAAKRGNESVIECLISSGAKINVQCQLGWTPLASTCSSKKSKVSFVKFFLKNGADPLISTRENRIPEQIALQFNRLDLAYAIRSSTKHAEFDKYKEVELK